MLPTAAGAATVWKKLGSGCEVLHYVPTPVAGLRRADTHDQALLESRLTRWPGEFIHIRTIFRAKVSADAPGDRYQAMFSEA